MRVLLLLPYEFSRCLVTHFSESCKGLGALIVTHDQQVQLKYCKPSWFKNFPLQVLSQFLNADRDGKRKSTQILSDLREIEPVTDWGSLGSFLHWDVPEVLLLLAAACGKKKADREMKARGRGERKAKGRAAVALLSFA